MVAINDPLREAVIDASEYWGMEFYKKWADGDDSPFVRKSVQNIIHHCQCPSCGAIARMGFEMSGIHSRYFNDSNCAFLVGMNAEAEKAGHMKNAEYLSKAIDELRG